MKFSSTEIAGAYLIDLEPMVDDRGFFARAWCRDEFARQELPLDWPQTNIAWSEKRGTLRGLHFVSPPLEEAKLVRCTRGAAYVVAVDLRSESPTNGRWFGSELNATNHRQLYVPPRCAQGYQTLVDDTEMLYQMSTSFVPGATRGVRFDDPYFQITWPLAVTVISSADRSWPPYASNSPQRSSSVLQTS